MLAVEVGVREAARRMGLSEEAVMKRSSREGWIRDLPRSERLPPTVLQPVSVVRTAPDAQADSIKERDKRSRSNHARAAETVSARIAEMEGDELLATMPAVLQSVKHASVTFGWAVGSNGQQSVRLDLIANSGGTALRLEMGGSVESESEEDEE